MNKGAIITIVVMVVLIAGGLIYWYSASSSSSYAPPPSTVPTPMPVQPTSTAATSTQATSTAPKAAVKTVTVTYTDSGFSPKTITIPKGGTVIFVNAASDAVRVASNPHPFHNGYPTTGGCVASTFDSCSNIAPGSSWSFTFDIVGSWGYHNHLNPGEKGTVVVQ